MKTTTLPSKLHPVVEAHYGEWEDANGYGPCGAVALARRMTFGWPVVVGYRHGEGEDPIMGTPHYVNRLPDGTLLDSSNPNGDTDTEFTTDEDAELGADELPDLADKDGARWWIAKRVWSTSRADRPIQRRQNMETYEIEIRVVVKVEAESREQASQAVREALNETLEEGLTCEGDVQSMAVVAVVKDSDREPATEVSPAFVQMTGGVSAALEQAEGEEPILAALERDHFDLGDLGEVVHTLTTWALHKSIDAQTVVQIWLDGNLPTEAWGHDLEE